MAEMTAVKVWLERWHPAGLTPADRAQMPTLEDLLAQPNIVDWMDQHPWGTEG